MLGLQATLAKENGGAIYLPVVCCDLYFLQLELPVEDFKILDPHRTSFMGGLCEMNASDLSLDILIF